MCAAPDPVQLFPQDATPTFQYVLLPKIKVGKSDEASQDQAHEEFVGSLAAEGRDGYIDGGDNSDTDQAPTGQIGPSELTRQ